MLNGLIIGRRVRLFPDEFVKENYQSHQHSLIAHILIQDYYTCVPQNHSTRSRGSDAEIGNPSSHPTSKSGLKQARAIPHNLLPCHEQQYPLLEVECYNI